MTIYLYRPGSGAYTEGSITKTKAGSKLTSLDLIWLDLSPDFGARKGRAGGPQEPWPGAPG